MKKGLLTSITQRLNTMAAKLLLVNDAKVIHINCAMPVQKGKEVAELARLLFSPNSNKITLLLSDTSGEIEESTKTLSEKEYHSIYNMSKSSNPDAAVTLFMKTF